MLSNHTKNPRVEKQDDDHQKPTDKPCTPIHRQPRCQVAPNDIANGWYKADSVVNLMVQDEYQQGKRAVDKHRKYLDGVGFNQIESQP